MPGVVRNSRSVGRRRPLRAAHARRTRLMATAVLFAGLLAACGADGDGGGDAGQDGTFVFGAQLSPGPLDPDLLTVKQMSLYLSPVYDTLVHLDPDGEFQPMLAESWEAGSDDGGDLMRLELRQGLEFADGTPFTSATVVANIERSKQLEGSTTAGEVAGVQVETEGDHAVILRDERGLGAILGTLAGPAGMMISDKAIAAGQDLAEEPAGIGPFTMERKDAARIVYGATEGYWDADAAASEQLEIVYLADDAKVNAVRSGELDATLMPDDNLAVAESSGYDVVETTGAENEVFALNTAIAPFDDVRVREAVNIALDRDGVCAGVFDGHCEGTGQLFGVGSTAHDPDLGLSQVEYDLDRAKQLIADAGAEGAKVEILTLAGFTSRVRIAEILQHQMVEIGLDAKVSPVSPPEIIGRFVATPKVAVALGSTGNSFDPLQDIERYVMPTGPYNPGKHVNKEVVELHGQARTELDLDARRELYRQISAASLADHQFIPISSPKPSFAVRKGVEGWETPWAPNFPSFRGVAG